jgi:sterol desaturase/sphingolipid hydroxylase (fatty acid hydroxylase superfamily)
MEHSFRETLLLLISTPLFMVFIAFEMLVSNWQRNGIYTRSGFLQNIYILAVNLAIDLAMRGLALYVLTGCYNHQLFSIQNKVAYWGILLLLQDLAFYTMHLVDHKVRLFWAVHITHHSSTEFNLAVGLRSSVFEPIYRFVYFMPLAWFGMQPVDILFVFSLTQMYGIFIHTQYVKKLGILEWFMATPSHHRVHHGQNPQYVDRNMGMFLIIWDKLFGTFTPEAEPVQYGVTKPPKNHHPVHIITHEFENMIADVQAAPTLRSKLMYIFGPPGWSHYEQAEATLSKA